MRLGVATAVLVMLASVPASAAGAPATRRCAGDKSVRCGSVSVPLLRGAPQGGGGKLRVQFRVFPRTDRSRPELEPVVAVEGGPGYPSIDSAPSYLFMLGRLRGRHDLIVVDNRGTGRSGAINCPRLQAGKGVYAREVGRCARRLGRRANAYGTGAAADDLATVLDKLDVPVVSIYGDSYRTYFAQAFAVRHRERVRAVVLDAAFGVDGFDPWGREESVALRFAWPEVCRRSTGCGGDVLALLRRWARRLEARPLTGTYGSNGHGLHGGSFAASGEYLAYGPIRLRLRRVRFVADLAVSGIVDRNRRDGGVRARLRLSGAASGTLRIAWSTGATRAVASLRGTLGGRAVRLQTPAP